MRLTSPGNTNPEPIKRALANKYIVTTGTANGDWGKIVQTGIYSEKSTPSGHIWQIN